MTWSMINRLANYCRYCISSSEINSKMIDNGVIGKGVVIDNGALIHCTLQWQNDVIFERHAHYHCSDF